VGKPRPAYGLYVIDLILMTTFLIAVARFQVEMVKAWVTPNALLLIMGVNVLLLIYRAGATAGAYAQAPAGTAAGPAGQASIAVALVLLVGPHLVVGYLSWAQYDLIESVFAEPVPIAAPLTTTTTTSPVTPPASEVTTTSTTIPSTTTTTAPPPIWDGLNRLNIVLLGADAGAGRTGIRTDTTIVVSLDPVSGDVAMFSVPRDLSNAPLPAGMGRWDCDCFPDLITHLYDAGVRYPDSFPGPADPPINAVKGALSEIFGIPIHYYAMVTLDGFVGVVDALGGVTIEVPETIVDETYPHEDGGVERVVIESGTQHLDGHHALAYARIRRHSDDFARMHRQRCVLGAVLDQTNPAEVIANFGSLAQAIKDNVSTDIPEDRLGDFVDLLPKLGADRVYGLRITRAEYKTGGAPGRVFYDIPRIRQDAQLIMRDPVAAQEQLGLGSLDTSCDESYD
jgi:LCP family protein required for cell wall assembly